MQLQACFETANFDRNATRHEHAVLGTWPPILANGWPPLSVRIREGLALATELTVFGQSMSQGQGTR